MNTGPTARGRATAWDSVRAGARGGKGRALAVSAPAGFGKSALLDLLAARAAGDGFRVLRTSGRLLDRDVPHSGTRQLLETVSSGDDRVLAGTAALARPLLSGEPSPADAFALQHALFWCLSNLAADGQLAVVVDDCHWLETPHRLAGGLPRRATKRPASGHRGRWWPQTFDDDRIHRNIWSRSDARVRLGPLSGEQMVSAIATAAPALATGEVETIVSLSAGNPFLVAEMLRGSVEGIAGSSDADVTAVVHDYVCARIFELSPQARQLLLVAGVLGDGESWALARELAGLEPDAAASARAELTGIAVVEKDESQVRFRHALLWEGALSAFPPSFGRSRTARSAWPWPHSAGWLRRLPTCCAANRPVTLEWSRSSCSRPRSSVTGATRPPRSPFCDEHWPSHPIRSADRCRPRARRRSVDHRGGRRGGAPACAHGRGSRRGEAGRCRADSRARPAVLRESEGGRAPVGTRCPGTPAAERCRRGDPGRGQRDRPDGALAGSSGSQHRVPARCGRRVRPPRSGRDECLRPGRRLDGTATEQVSLLASVLDDVVESSVRRPPSSAC